MNIQPVEVLVTVPLTDTLVDELRDISPRLRITHEIARRAEDIPAEIWSRTEVLYTDRLLPTAAQSPGLKWVQFHYAGIDHALESPLMQHDEIAFTTLSGAASPQMAEFAVMMMLALGHRLNEMQDLQEKAEWPKDRWERLRPRELRGSTVGLIGYGSIGREIARLLQPFQVKILAAKRDVMHPQDSGYTPEGMGDPDGNLFHRLYPIQALRSMLKECDYVVLSLPLNQHTRGIIGQAELDSMKKTAFLVDFGRGGIIDPTALLTTLRERRIAGAALDVFAEEPLPANNPLWKMPNVIISPHIAGISPNYDERAMALFSENLKRYLSDAALLNRFDPQKGY